MKTFLVTGASGALGRAVCARLGEDGQRVITAGRSAGNEVRLDLSRPEEIQAVLASSRPDVILHLAASFSGDYAQAVALNVEASRQLLEAVAQAGPAVRVVLIGSAAEYGVVEPEENPIGEERVLKPVSVYGMSKAWQTQLAYLYAARGVDVVVARVFNLSGPGMSERLFTGRLQQQIEAVLAGRQQRIELGPLGATRDYLSTGDAAAQLLAIAALAPAGSVHNVASGKPVTMRELMERTLAEHGLDPAIVDEAPALSNRSGYDVPVIYADIVKTRALMRQWRNGEN
jgi:GDP-4-dehydro-6-deoxy-D-mannose reductase